MEASGIFKITRDIDGYPTLEELEKEVASSRYVIGIYILENTTESIRRNVARYVLATFSETTDLPPMDNVNFVVFRRTHHQGFLYATIIVP